MNYLQEAIDIESLFATSWALVRPGVPIEYDNSDFDPLSGVPYVTLSILSGTAFQADLGKPTNTYRHHGMIIGQIRSPTDVGTAVARELADDFAHIFRTEFVGSGIVTKTPDFIWVGRNGDYYQVNVKVPFHRDAIF